MACDLQTVDTRPLTAHAKKMLTDNLDHLSMKALNGIVKGEKSDKGIQKVHLESIIRYLLHILNWREGLEDTDSLMNSSIWDAHFSSQNKPDDSTDAPIVTRDSTEEQTDDKDDPITPSQVDALFSSQINPDVHSSANSVTKDSEENETEHEDPNKTKVVLEEMAQILAENQPSCKQCDSKFEDADKLKEHELTHEKSQTTGQNEEIEILEKPYGCGQCEKKFSVILELENHVRTHSVSAPAKSYKWCRHCGLKMPEEALENHEIKVHGKRKAEEKKAQKETAHFNCQKCNQTFKDRFQHQQHTCRQIQKTLVRPAQDETDIELSNSNEKPFNCSQCDSKFSVLDDLTSHKKKHICQQYKKGQCQFGPRGSNSQGKCHYSHSRPCFYFETPAGCKKKENCDFLHRTNRVRGHVGAHHANRDFIQGGQSNDLPFLDQGQMMMEILLQLRKLSQDQNNNRGPRTPHFQR